MASKNKLQIDYDSVEYEVISNISFEDIMNMNNVIISIRIECDFELNLKLLSLIKRCFSLSTTRLKHLFEEGNMTLTFAKLGSSGMIAALISGLFTGAVMNLFASHSFFAFR